MISAVAAAKWQHVMHLKRRMLSESMRALHGRICTGCRVFAKPLGCNSSANWPCLHQLKPGWWYGHYPACMSFCTVQESQLAGRPSLHRQKHWPIWVVQALVWLGLCFHPDERTICFVFWLTQPGKQRCAKRKHPHESWRITLWLWPAMPLRSSAWSWPKREQITMIAGFDYDPGFRCEHSHHFASEVSLGLFLVMRIRRQVPGPEYVENSVLVAPSFSFWSWHWDGHPWNPFQSTWYVECFLSNTVCFTFHFAFLSNLSFFQLWLCVGHVVFPCAKNHGLPGIKGVSRGWGVASDGWELLRAVESCWMPRWRTRSSKVMTRVPELELPVCFFGWDVSRICCIYLIAADDRPATKHLLKCCKAMFGNVWYLTSKAK